MENTQDHASASTEQVIANQWIDYLKRKNSQLTFLWVFFLLLAVSASIFGAWSFWQKLEVSDALTVAESELVELSAEKLSVIQDRDTLSARLSESEAALQASEEAMVALQNSNGETGSQLNLTTRLVAALKQKVASLESENSLLENALNDSEIKATKLISRNQEYKKAAEEQRQSLSARKSAYDALAKRQVETQEEMQRLATELNEAKERESNLDQRNARLSKELKASNAELRKVDAEKNILESKLKTLTMPIQTGRSVNSVPKMVQKKAPTPVIKETAPAELEQPKTDDNNKKEKKISVNIAPLDFDSIAIE
jgi:myosin heavy subunit